MTDLRARLVGDGPPIVLLHPLGLDGTVFDPLIELLPGHRVLCPDLRGHGQSPVPPGPYNMGALIRDVERCMQAHTMTEAVVFGLSLGGLIAQGLAVKRLDLVRALVLSGTAAKFGQPGPWLTRAQTARTRGMRALAPDILTRWTPLGAHDAALDAALRDTDPYGYAATCEAISGTDFYTPTSGLRLPTLGICGTLDASTPTDLMRETTNLVPGSDFHLIRQAGHLAPLTHATEVAALLQSFLTRIGHV